jgi:hypothetical protein
MKCTDEDYPMNKTSGKSKRQTKLPSLKPMSLEEFYARNAQSQKDIKEGRVYSTKEVLKRLGIKRK